MSIRAYKPEDLPALVNLFTRSVREINSRDYTSFQIKAWAPDNPDLATWQERFCLGQIWVAEIAGTLAGFIQFEDNGHIDLLYVHPEFQRQGIASELLDNVLLLARQKQLSRVFTEASITARPLFERFSFRVIHSQQVLFRGVQFENFVMERFL